VAQYAGAYPNSQCPIPNALCPIPNSQLLVLIKKNV